MERRTFVLQNDLIRQRAVEAIRTAPEGMTVTIKPATRSLEQNSLLWPLLHAVSQQVDWYGHKLTPEQWKDVFTAALKRQKVVPGLDGGFVVVGASTSKMGKREFSDLLELIFAFGAEKGVVFNDQDRAHAVGCGG